MESRGHRDLANGLRATEARLASRLLARQKAHRRLAAVQDGLTIIEAKIIQLGERTESAQQRHDLSKQRTSRWQCRTATTKAIEGLDKEIADLDAQGEKLQASLTAMLKDTSRLQALVAENYQLLDTRAKAVFDALRIVASNMFATLAVPFRRIYGNHRNDHVLLRMLTRADGFVQCVDGTLHVRLWLKGRYQKKQVAAFKQFLAETGESINQTFAGRAPQLRISLVRQPSERADPNPAQAA